MGGEVGARVSHCVAAEEVFGMEMGFECDECGVVMDNAEGARIGYGDKKDGRRRGWEKHFSPYIEVKVLIFSRSCGTAWG